ncbi:FG-GAP repeat protein [Streptomyces arenae]|nr:FG-GAP repeat protein [Streptomyces arenae]
MSARHPRSPQESRMAQHRRTSVPRSRRTRLTAATAAAAALTGGLLTVSAGAATAAPAGGLSAHEADFNGDGVFDLATSEPSANVGGKDQAGQVTVTYGGSTLRHKTFGQNSAGVPGTAEKGDGFGTDTAYGDFDRDGYDDLAVAAPGEDRTSRAEGRAAMRNTTLRQPRMSHR